jgi:hypothetical protein
MKIPQASTFLWEWQTALLLQAKAMWRFQRPQAHMIAFVVADNRNGFSLRSW